jgi:MFS superfamily sulfate permease-like transporter
VVSIINLVLLFGMEKLAPRIPAALVVVILGILISAVFDLEEIGVHIVGDIPAGLPSIGLPDVKLSELLLLLPGAMGIALVAFCRVNSRCPIICPKTPL